ncbi:DUF1614 domain-containing protein [Paraglaciecola sp. MB-3u-78]
MGLASIGGAGTFDGIVISGLLAGVTCLSALTGNRLIDDSA